jgi:hypothetical protein
MYAVRHTEYDDAVLTADVKARNPSVVACLGMT